jgi:hypothetical protein
VNERLVTWIVLIGAGIIGVATAAVSSVTLYSLAVHIKIEDLHYLPSALPISLDMGAAVSALVWITSNKGSELRKWARGMALGSLAATVVGNALEHAIAGGFIGVSLWITVAVGSLIPLALFCTLHLIALMFHPEASKAKKEAPKKQEQKKSEPQAGKELQPPKPKKTDELSGHRADATAKKAWIRERLEAGVETTGKDVNEHFNDNSRNGYRLVNQVLAQIKKEAS